ncbi:murein biosynthesis integral membrane protein MurJ [Clostridium sp. DJ247]|uniref:murein biosynthesis integral membrane protein MurJ n=1 Tax=Clostridium sp. DJ247 TaxID=2726188 RepID=UPI001628781D|nr:murein biosynthesis integral membrane protein MurJ [Clostridium sp. DJ247]MBC2580246.1 murein biosynthesis integral membrane protein MurJ [Clostridium sp. DJ247]
MSKKTLAKAAVIIMVVSLISRATGFLRDSLNGGAFGATDTYGAYLLSLTVPNILFGIFGLAITTTFIPILSETYKENGKEKMFEFANSVMNILMIVSLILCFIGWIFTPEIVGVLTSASKDKAHNINLVIYLTKISMINILFLGLTSGYTAILQALDDFTAPALVGIVANIPVILYVLMGHKYGIVGLTVITMVGNGLQILTQIPWLLRNKYKYRFKINLKDPKIKKMFLLIAPIIIGTGVSQINVAIQNSLAYGLPEGSLVALDFANKLNQLIYFTFASAIVTVIFPSLSREGSSKGYDTFKTHITNAVNNINLVTIPACVGLLILRIPIISVLFMHGAFDERGVKMTSVALFYLVSGIIFWGVRDVFNRAFYAIQDTKTPMINGAVGVIVSAICSLFLVKLMGIGGLTLATTISALVSCILLVIDLKRKIGSVNGMEMFVTGSKIIAASGVMGLVIYFINDYLKVFLTGTKGQLTIIILCAIVGVLVYVIMLLIFRVKELMTIFNVIKSRIKG